MRTTRRAAILAAAALALPLPVVARIRPEGVYAMKGERVTCEKGHLVAVFAQDVMRGEVASPSQLQWATGGKPQGGTAVQPCACGAPIFRGPGMKAHIEGEWR